MGSSAAEAQINNRAQGSLRVMGQVVTISTEQEARDARCSPTFGEKNPLSPRGAAQDQKVELPGQLHDLLDRVALPDLLADGDLEYARYLPHALEGGGGPVLVLVAVQEIRVLHADGVDFGLPAPRQVDGHFQGPVRTWASR